MILKRQRYTISVETMWFGHIIHGDVHGFYGRSVRQAIRADLSLLARSLSQPLYAFQCQSHDPKKERFIRGLGFVPDHRRMTGDGEWADMYRWPTLDQSKVTYGQSFQVQNIDYE